ncbi:MAG: ABC transporter permease [Gemmatimonadetes bacterium]|nr:ABC transporter permease [Gemmatimonadota bacterium]
MIAGRPLVGYLRWHAQDTVLRALTPPILFLGLGGVPLWSFARTAGLDAMDRPGEAHDLALQIYGNTMPLTMTLGAVLLANGLHATDREKQYFRFLFSKPVVAWAFYLQQFVVALLLFAAAMTLVPLGFGAIVTAVPVLAVTKSAVLFALLYGSLVALCGSLVTKEGVVFIAVAATSMVLQQLGKAGFLPHWLALVAGALPPFLTADSLRGLWLAGQPVAAGDIMHVVGYSTAMLAAALLLVRRLPLARS